jgi:magnesium chelatase subunit D
VRRGTPRGGARVDLVATLRAAVPWQRARGRVTAEERLAIRRDDLRLRRMVEPSGTTVVVVVDASGSAAMHRMAEAKGVVELLLAASYARRDRVSLIAFRKTSAEVLLPPTRALARAKRLLTALPAGGGTPLACGLDVASDVAEHARRAGSDVTVVLFTDGHANVARDGRGGRPQAAADALSAGRRLRALDVNTLFIDTSPRPHPFADALAGALGARHVALPSADARQVSALVRGMPRS